jgi:sigma-B regulation protein RsbU (phosphoserine phosphatase)
MMVEPLLNRLSAHQALLDSLAAAWLAAGARSFSLWQAGRALAMWPADTPHPAENALVCTIRAGEADETAPIQLRVDIASTLACQARLTSDAALLAQLLQSEREMDALTAELVANQDQLMALYDLSQLHRGAQSTQSLIDIHAILDNQVHEVARLTNTHCACYLLLDEDAPPYIAQHPAPLMAAPLMYRLLQQATGKRECVFNHDELPLGLEACAGNLLVVPMRVRGATHAGMFLATPPGGRITSPDLKLARTISEQVSAQLENAILYRESLEQTKLRTEMELAQQVQAHLLPQRLPQVPGLDLFASSHPAMQVGGDFYDLIYRPGKPFIFSVGDVAGKGMPAALIMAMSHTVIRNAAHFMPSPIPDNLLRRVSDNLYSDLTELGLFVTTFAGHYDPARRQLLYANAGHSPVIYKPAHGAAILLEADAPPIGVLPDSLAENHAITIEPGDLLVVATDGFSEARNAHDELFGNERLLGHINALAGQSVSAIAQRLYQLIDEFGTGHPQDDDQTLILIKATGG